MGSINTETHTGTRIRYYDTFAGGLDLVALGETGDYPRSVTVLDAEEGQVFEFVDATGHTSSPPPDKLVGHTIVGAVASITANTNVGLVEVIW